jgi:type VI secretion system protein ImpC
MEPRAVDLDDLLSHVEEKDGERRVKPCAETLLTIRAAELILDAGFMPLLSFRATREHRSRITAR